jgi:hypothetical protein
MNPPPHSYNKQPIVVPVNNKKTYILTMSLSKAEAKRKKRKKEIPYNEGM